jgi:hypothetical protein
VTTFDLHILQAVALNKYENIGKVVCVEGTENNENCFLGLVVERKFLIISAAITEYDIE